MGHYITGYCWTHGEVDMDDSLAYCEDCYETVPKGEIARLTAKIEELADAAADLVGLDEDYCACDHPPEYECITCKCKRLIAAARAQEATR